MPLRLENELWERTFDAVPDLIMILDNDYRVVRVNHSLASKFGCQIDDVLGKRCYSCLHGLDGPPENCPHALTLRDGLSHSMETYEPRLGGHFLVTTTPLRDHAGPIIGSVHVACDITHIKRAAEMLQAQEKLAAIGRIVAKIAHEINNPLAGIRNSFALISDAIPREHPHFDYVGRISRELDRISRVTRELHGLFRPEPSPPCRINLIESLTDVVKLMELRQTSKVKLQLHLPGQPVMVQTAENSLRQILYNLIQNALDVSPAGGVITVKLVVDEKVKILVGDQGPGIAPEINEKIFEPFFSTKSGLGSSGMGLGLSISRTLAQSMGGSLEYESRPGQGCVFKLSLPLEYYGQ